MVDRCTKLTTEQRAGERTVACRLAIASRSLRLGGEPEQGAVGGGDYHAVWGGQGTLDDPRPGAGPEGPAGGGVQGEQTVPGGDVQSPPGPDRRTDGRLDRHPPARRPGGGVDGGDVACRRQIDGVALQERPVLPPTPDRELPAADATAGVEGR